jgi:hypothetical protein
MSLIEPLYRTISFQKKESEVSWGYPNPHLLAIQYTEFPYLVNENMCHIHFHFSSECVQVEGFKLRRLRDELVINLPELICEGKATTGADYEVTMISIVDS